MSEPVIRTESLGGPPLSLAARAGQLPRWYRPIPRGSREWRDYADDVAASVPPQWLNELEPAIAPHGAAAARLARSANGKGLIVTTGQQPGLFGGPLMTLVKAITARALADTLEELLDTPVAPVFWAATDDADFDEAAVVTVAVDGGARELRLAQRSPAGTPMARVLIDDEIRHLAPLLQDACGSGTHASYLELVLQAYHEGATIGDAYVDVLRRVLEPLEIAVLDASHPSVARAAAPLMRRAATSADLLARAVRARGDEITLAGFKPQVEEVTGLSLVFLNERGTKRRLPIREAETLGQLGDGQFLSATVLLRPVVERSLLPTAAYVGGPGEVAYFAQATAVADALGVPAPLVVPRWSTTIIEPRVQRTLTELGISADSLADPHAVENRQARERMVPAMARALSMLREGVTAGIGSVTAANEAVVPSSVIDGLQRALDHRVARLERRIVASIKRREQDLMRRVSTARGALYPHGSRQERKLAFAPFLARYGPPIVEQMLDAARLHARALVAGSPTIVPPPTAAPANV